MSDPVDNRLAADGAAGRTSPASPGTLADRVLSLRLAPQVTAGRARGSRLPWVLCLLLLVTSTAFGYRAFTAGRSSPGQPAEAGVKPSSADDAVAGSGDVVLESKGYIIPAHQIQ